MDSAATALECGAARVDLLVRRDDLPRIIRAGRHIGRTKRYVRNYAHELEPDRVVEYVAGFTSTALTFSFILDGVRPPLNVDG